MNFSFRNKFLIITIALVCISQAATFVTFFVTSDKTVKQQIDKELLTGVELFEKLLEQRNKDLLSGIEVLASDYEFRQSIINEDIKATQNALLNQVSRIEADFAMLASLNGVVLTSTLDNLNNTNFPFYNLINQAPNQDHILATAIISGKPYQIVAVPVNSPGKTAWIFMSFAIDAELAKYLKSITGLDVTFLSYTNVITPYVTSTLNDVTYMNISTENIIKLITNNKVVTQTLNNHEYLTLAQSISSQHGAIVTVLQKSLSAAMQPYHSLWKDALASILLALVLSILICSVLARGITRPIEKLSRAANRMKLGDYDHRIELDQDDEFGDLASSFNLMQENIAQRESRITHIAHHDALTDLPNRVHANEALEAAISNAEVNHSHVAILLMDLDRFKEINDTLGHHIGDILLQEVASKLTCHLNDRDVVARLGGDEFLVILENTDLAKAKMSADQISKLLRNKFNILDTTISVDVSIGISTYPAHGNSAESLLRRADIAMYDAKASHKSSVAYTKGRDDNYIKQLSIVRDIQNAISEDQFQIHYQPKTEINYRRVKHVEALLRWDHPKLGLISPDEFIPLAEQSGNIGLITDWVLKTVIKQMADWNKNDIYINVAVNISALDLLHDDITENISSYLSESSVKPSMLTLEITESTVMRDINHSLNILNKFKDMGLMLSIDDFGIGFSSLAHLKRLPIDELKIDKSFVINLKDNKEDIVIIRSIINLGHNIGLKVIAEGVEDAESWNILKQHGCDMIQGYFITKPLPAEYFVEWLKYKSRKQIASFNETLLAKIA